MRKISFIIVFGVSLYVTNAQTDKEKQQLKNIILTAYESVSQSSRQWLADATDKHPAGEFDTAYAKSKLKTRFSQVQLDATADLWACMIAYQKLVYKEAREDRKIQKAAREIMLASKEKKLEMDNQAIDAQMQEAREKARAAMDAATTQLVTAIVSGLLQIGPAASSFSREDQGKPKKDSLRPINKTIPVKTKLTLTEYIKRLEVQLKLVSGK